MAGLAVLAVLLATVAAGHHHSHDEDYDYYPDEPYAPTEHLTPGEECDRPCPTSPDPKTCYFDFRIEEYTSMNPACKSCSYANHSDCFSAQCVPLDGVSRPITSVNRGVPGPPIKVCVGDTVVVEMTNAMSAASISCHWHGIKQRGTPYMDGVPMVSQCPQLFGTSFVYTFKANEKRNSFYHSHVGIQKGEGMEGVLTVREPKETDYHGALYDEELVLFLQDWTADTSPTYTPGLHIPGHSQGPYMITINGFAPFTGIASKPRVPIWTFNVKKGLRYKLQIICATTLTCGYAVKIESHPMTVISLDGSLAIEPVTVDTFCCNSAERASAIVLADQTPGSYYIHVQSLSPVCKDINQVAVLQYEDADQDLVFPPPVVQDYGVMLNKPGATCNNSNEICVTQLRGLESYSNVHCEDHHTIMLRLNFTIQSPDQLFQPGLYIPYEELAYNFLLFSSMGGNSFRVPPSPLSTQFSDIPEQSFCPEDCYQGTAEGHCACTSYYSVTLNSCVFLVVYDTGGPNGGINHPFHLHGFDFAVLEMGIFSTADNTERVEVLERRVEALKRDKSSRSYRALKDTVSVPGGGYVILWFHADNPGWWFAHCHYQFHLHSGMATVIKVGEDWDMHPVPRGFPKCGNYYGDLRDTSGND